MLHNTRIFPQSNISIYDLTNEINAAKLHINRIQTEAKNHADCYLSFYPVAKNVRFLSSWFCKRIQEGSKPQVSLQARNSEESFWCQYAKEKSWYPWLWSRCYPNNKNTKESIENIFRPITEMIDISDINDENIEHLKNLHFNDFVLYLASLTHVFRFQESFFTSITSKYLRKNWPNNKVCALQIRRGEIASKDAKVEESWHGRKMFLEDEYMQHAMDICKLLDTNYIFISTDSHETISYLESKYKDYNFIYNNFDRNLFIRYDKNRSEFADVPALELQIARKPELIQLYTESCMADLFGLSQCNGYVGGMTTSEYGICGWFLQMANQKQITPYFNLEGIFNLDNQNVGLYLL